MHKSHAILLYFLLVLFNSSNSSLTKLCDEHSRRIKLEFHPLRHCQRSNSSVIASRNVESAKLCAAYARSQRGLAFNFSPKNRSGKNFFDVEPNKNVTEKESSYKSQEEFYNCEVLACPETRNYSTIVNDTRFDYYTLYAHPAPVENATCIPSLGMFLIYKERRNYSEALRTCKSVKGQLAHIASERRTNEISKLLLQQHSEKSSSSSSSSTGGEAAAAATSKELLAFVGLNETTRGKFTTSSSEPLECFDYLAFAPGHPPEIRKPSCVAVTERASWRVISCIKKVMFVCEILANGPNPYVNNIHQMCSTKRPNNRFAIRKSASESSLP